MNAAPLTEADKAIVAAVQRGDVRQAARLITRIEAGEPALGPLLGYISHHARNTPVIGITGPPGAGKSTLLDHLVSQYRQQGLRIAILAVDPSSPLSGGAILGDRIRLGRHGADSGVFIRSMASRSRLGGMAAAAGDALKVLDILGFDRIFVETVGVGQNEVDIMHHADSVLVAVTPHSGDAVQAIKAGILEIGDIYLINKTDSPGADRTLAALQGALSGSCDHGQWQPPILKIQANIGAGIDTVVDAIEDHQRYWTTHPEQRIERRRRRLAFQLRQLIFAAVERRLYEPGPTRDQFENALEEILDQRSDPYAAAMAIVASMGWQK